MKKTFYILLLLLTVSSFFTIIGCDNGNGLFGHSETKEEAKANGSTIVQFVPDKTNFDLLDGTKIKIDTAWTEISFTYKNGDKVFDSAYGYNFSVPYKREDPTSFSFYLSLADTTNQIFTNSMGKNSCQLRPKYLHDKMKILFEQKDTDTLIGWKHSIITDTITFTRIK